MFFELALTDLRRAADLFAPVHEYSDGVDGWVSLEVSPLLARDTKATIEQVKALHAKAGRPNLFIKIPGTSEGLSAIEECTFAGLPINATSRDRRAFPRPAAHPCHAALARRRASKGGQ